MIKRQLVQLCLVLLIGVTSFPGMTCTEVEARGSKSMMLPQQNEQPINLVFSLANDDIRWMRTYGGARDDTARSVIQTTDGNFVLAGSTAFLTSWLMKTDYFGNVQWTQTYNLSYPNIVLETADGGYALAGTRVDYLRKTSEAGIVKTDAEGTVQWYQTYKIENQNEATSVIQTADGGFLLGVSSSAGAYTLAGTKDYKKDWDVWLIKMDASGNREWVKTYGGEDHDTVEMVIPTADRGFVFIGDTWSYGAGYNDIWLTKLNNQGVMEWNRTYGGLEAEKGYTVLETPESGFVLIGGTSSFGAGDIDAWIIKTDVDGNMQWNRTYGDVYYNSVSSGTLTADGGFVLAGYTQIYRTKNKKDVDLWIVKLNSRGLFRWEQTYGGLGDDAANSIIQTTDECFLLAGKTRSYEESGGVRDKSDWDAWLVKTDAQGVAPDIEIELINWFEIGLVVTLTIAAITVVVLWVRAVRRSRPKWQR